jgi:DNA-binding response OmpR family regulator
MVDGSQIKLAEVFEVVLGQSMDSSNYNLECTTRTNDHDDSPIYDDFHLRIEHNSYFLACKGTPVILTRTEFRLVSRLIRSMDRIVSFSELWTYAWGPAKPLNLKSIHVYMSRLRRRLRPFDIRIDSIVNVGYMLSYGSSGRKKRGTAPEARCES